ncbi:helix-turn-helix domain-containing protein [Streptomyces sp. NPDC051211]|uniref:helix-turn-helix domain-containing protein n=1 Tax=Streptomyces sp. NPDC051211 TaxID=3154643 RepID=UPI0034509E9D
MTTELADNVRKYRRRAGMSQEELAHVAAVSPGTVRKVEQGGTVRMETLHALARALGVTTGALMASDAPEPVGRAEEPNRVNLIQLRAVLTPAVGLVDQDAEVVGEEPNLRAFRRTVGDARVLYFSDSYKSVASQLPDLLRDAAKAVAYYDTGDEHQQALLARAEALRLAGTYLTQVRQYDIAYTALAGAITDARRAGDMLAAGSGVGGMCWLLVRQGRLDEAELIAAQSMDAVEPKITGAESDHYAVWGGLAMEAAAAAARNNRPDSAKEYRKAARVAAAAVGTSHRNVSRHWSVFGPVTAAMASRARETGSLRRHSKTMPKVTSSLRLWQARIVAVLPRCTWIELFARSVRTAWLDMLTLRGSMRSWCLIAMVSPVSTLAPAVSIRS